MRIDEIMTRSEDVLTRYYQNEIEPFLDSCDEDIIWIGPAENQIIKTRENLVNTFAAEENNLHGASEADRSLHCPGIQDRKP